ncbi:hypothetical protein C5167_014030 [Papaver somniferum]|uniref:Uncharacterized protein n=1 Tax=Papaver somniferum TaxID=3469 RepID=A0A4Y7J626_PAPSO|nr:hypothetical protein C5167_014030 [Papaver somniferum]
MAGLGVILNLTLLFGESLSRRKQGHKYWRGEMSFGVLTKIDIMDKGIDVFDAQKPSNVEIVEETERLLGSSSELLGSLKCGHLPTSV